MKVKKRMAKKLVTITKEATIADAVNLMKEHSIRHLPVVEEGALIGWVTESDIELVISNLRAVLPQAGFRS